MPANVYSNPGGTYDGTALVEYPNQPTFGRSDGSRSIKYRYWCKTSLAHDGTGGLIPVRFSPKTFQGIDYYLVDAQTSETEDPTISNVVLSYNRSASRIDPIRTDGDIERRAELIQLERTKTQSSPGAGTSEETEKFWGVEYEYSETISNLSWTEENVLKSINLLVSSRDRSNPPGISNFNTDDDGEWLFCGCSIRETPRQDDGAGDYTPAIATKVETWWYSPFGWDGVVAA